MKEITLDDMENRLTSLTNKDWEDIEQEVQHHIKEAENEPTKND